MEKKVPVYRYKWRKKYQYIGTNGEKSTSISVQGCFFFYLGEIYRVRKGSRKGSRGRGRVSVKEGKGRSKSL